VTASGVVVKARPFFYTLSSGSGLHFDLITDDGRRIECIDTSNGVYCFDEGGELIYLKPRPSAIDAAC
jgi:hypothetical protein